MPQSWSSVVQCDSVEEPHFVSDHQRVRLHLQETRAIGRSRRKHHPVVPYSGSSAESIHRGVIGRYDSTKIGSCSNQTDVGPYSAALRKVYSARPYPREATSEIGNSTNSSAESSAHFGSRGAISGRCGRGYRGELNPIRQRLTRAK